MSDVFKYILYIAVMVMDVVSVTLNENSALMRFFLSLCIGILGFVVGVMAAPAIV